MIDLLYHKRSPLISTGADEKNKKQVTERL